MTGEGRDEVHQRWSKAPGRQCVAPRTSTGHARTMRVRVDNWVGRSLMLSGDRRPAAEGLGDAAPVQRRAAEGRLVGRVSARCCATMPSDVGYRVTIGPW